MKFVGLEFVPKAVFTFTEKDVEVLTLCGAAHYDRVCQEAVKPGGFVWGWRNRIMNTEPGSEEEAQITATFHDLDLASKILEMGSPLLGTSSPSYQVVVELTLTLRKMMEVINKAYRKSYKASGRDF